MPKLTLIPIILISIFLLPSFAFAQNADDSMGFANYVPIKEKSVKDGDIISVSPSGYFLTKTPYDMSMVGVVNEKPAVAISIETQEKTYPVVGSGNALVNVITENGDIKQGDSITSSTTPGVGMKADKPGFVVGMALDDYKSSNKKEVGKINVALNIRYSSPKQNAQAGFKDLLSLTALATTESPTTFLKYVASAFILIIAFVIGFFTFGRVASTGLEALGRNPLAGKMIQFGILLNVLITAVIVAAGVGIAYFILKM